MKPLKVLKPFKLKFMASEAAARKGGRQRCEGTSKDLPEDLAEMYKTDPEENYGQRKTRIQWIRRYWVNNGSNTASSPRSMLRNVPSRSHGGASYTRISCPRPEMKPLLKASTHAWSEDHSLLMRIRRHSSGVVTTISSSATFILPNSQRS